MSFTTQKKNNQTKNPMTKKNGSDFLHVDFIQTPLVGQIGLTHCPGRSSLDAAGKQWNRDLAQDVAAIKHHNIAVVISLLSQEELRHHGAGDIEELLSKAQIEWCQFPITDFGTPSAEVAEHWAQTMPSLLTHLQKGQKILIHCAAGYGRTGMMTATLLVAMGIDAEKAVENVRLVRPGTIETPEQEAFIRSLQTL
jgi:ADP-ribosyl-[dinitrogen reductase] hydrolase